MQCRVTTHRVYLELSKSTIGLSVEIINEIIEWTMLCRP